MNAKPKHGKGRRGGLPSVTVIDIVALDDSGEAVARPARWDDDAPPPRIRVRHGPGSGAAPAVGDRALARMTKEAPERYRADIIRRLPPQTRQLLGVFERGAEGPRLRPIERGSRHDYLVREDKAVPAEPGVVYRAEVIEQRHRHLGLKTVRLLERIAAESDPGAFSLLAIFEQGIPLEFPTEALQEAQAAGAADAGGREDLRRLPLVTIDGADARDFDDAVFAEPDPDGDSPQGADSGGWHLVVAIADVAWYVRPGSALDRAAETRGNSVYFPDRVVPMLPEALSNGWCSLLPGADRPCMAVHLWIDGQGEIKRHRFTRAVMHSHARLTYEEVEAALKGNADGRLPDRALQEAISHLQGAHGALLRARKARGSLELELPERQVLLDDAGRVRAIRPRPRLASHRIIEDFMITANVAAALELQDKGLPCMYRVHEAPDPVKLEGLRKVLDSLDIKGLRLARGQAPRPGDLNALLTKIGDHPERSFLHETILRTQSQAAYAPRNLGHFGLGLRHYAHFTSPIRRYADLLVHRALLRGLGQGDGALPGEAGADFAEIGKAISATERRAMVAERQVVDRYTAAFLAGQEGSQFEGRIAGCTRAGLFVELVETGAQGLLPMSALPDDRYDLDPSGSGLVGRRWGRSYRLGAPLTVRLVECRPLAGGLLFEPAESAEEGPRRRSGKAAKAAAGRPQKRRKGGRGRSR